MRHDIILQLNQLNQKFYQQIAPDFSETRQQPWVGWQQLLPHLQRLATLQKVSVLDLGCGNGRWLKFLLQQFPQVPWQYEGIDTNEVLLNEARKIVLPALDQTPAQADFIQADLVESLFQPSQIPPQTYDLVVGFGIFHHIPSLELRQKLLLLVSDILKSNGLAIFSSWNFVEDSRLMTRAITPKEIDFSANDLEPDDYFLNWQRGEHAVRYCHLMKESEWQNLIQTAGLETVHRFSSDGHFDHLNTYYLLSKISLI